MKIDIEVCKNLLHLLDIKLKKKQAGNATGFV
jgi:hypothetical protein